MFCDMVSWVFGVLWREEDCMCCAAENKRRRGEEEKWEKGEKREKREKRKMDFVKNRIRIRITHPPESLWLAGGTWGGQRESDPGSRRVSS
jgi:hypothetical protein